MFLVYYLFIYPISILPFKALYFFSDFLYFVVYRIFGYRRKVVFNNLKNSFPNKSHAEIKDLERKFYSHLCDLIMESFKSFTISREKAHERIKFTNTELLQEIFLEGKDVILVGGHYGNWEMFAITLSDTMNHVPLALYTPLSNKFFNEKIKYSRSRFGLKLVSVGDAKILMDTIGSATKHALIFGSDQAPRKSQKAYWMNFLNQETGVQYGVEKWAREKNIPVVQGNIYKRSRGQYEVVYQLITKDPSSLEEGQITYQSTKILETIINQQPEYWLWSHKRWKHPRPEGEVLHT